MKHNLGILFLEDTIFCSGYYFCDIGLVVTSWSKGGSNLRSYFSSRGLYICNGGSSRVLWKLINYGFHSFSVITPSG